MLTNLITCVPMVLCMLLGMCLMIVEVFIPGFGLPGICGLLLIGAGTVIASMHHGMIVGIAVLLVVIAVLAILISALLHSAAKGGVRTKLFLQEKEELHTQKDMQVLVGKQGCTTTVLRPAGIGDFDGVRLNVVTEGGFIESGMPIEIVSVDGSKIVVRARAQT